ncbi:expressed unknown protein [Seminavis robusta]|uniref:Uncharacterized protein n=1 Tax=Seminavis robusta TaxID=568900 RepID=A0A9N8DXQ8_9STRA|nr:expressed unknown protein [Seminavis robusta]|eukprot:Sro324_g117680.1 n/a (349) ;mRNA; f:72430-73476
MVKQSLHEQRKQEKALLKEKQKEQKEVNIMAERVRQQRQLQEAARAQVESKAALDASRQAARLHGMARLVLTLLAVVFMAAFSFLREGRVLMKSSDATTVHDKHAAISSLLHDYTINMSALAMPNLEPFDMSKYDAIHLYHVRKAGGSTIRKYLENVAKHHGLKYSVNEGYGYRGKQHRNRTLMITMVRDPLARAESSYWFEGTVNASNPHSFRDWVEKRKDYHEFMADGRGYFVWQCASNCMTKWFSGTVPGNLTKAKHVLEHDFDLIIQQNRMDDPRYKRWISFLLDAPEVKLDHRNPSRRNHVPRLAQAGPTPEDREYLREINQEDLELMDHILPRRNDLDGYIY